MFSSIWGLRPLPKWPYGWIALEEFLGLTVEKIGHFMNCFGINFNSTKVYIKWKFLFSILVLRDHPCAAIGGFFHLCAKSCKIVTLDIFPYMILLAIIHVNLIYIIKVCLGFYPSLFSPKPPILMKKKNLV